jgi:adenylate kinase
MAPIQDASVDDLKHKVSTLEARIAELETRLGGGQAAAPQGQDGVRMILMGPPGAGKLAAPSTRMRR